LTQIVLGVLAEESNVIDDKYLGTATASSGNDPTYVPPFVEGLVDAGVRIGWPRDMAQESVMQTILGSTRTVDRTDKHTADLRNMSTSPG
jgi:pyrroline-5-carboxylate reductase